MSNRFRKIVLSICVILYALVSFMKGMVVNYIGLVLVGAVTILLSITYLVTNRPLSKKALWGEFISDGAILVVVIYSVVRAGQWSY
ncbi:MAG: hypothetical protein ACM3ZQ_10370 [Bacillota bacterium]